MEDNYLKELIRKRDAAVNSSERGKKFQAELELSLIGIKNPTERLCAIMVKISDNMSKTNENLRKIEGILNRGNK